SCALTTPAPFISFCQLPRPPPTSPLFPYTTLFRSGSRPITRPPPPPPRQPVLVNGSSTARSCRPRSVPRPWQCARSGALRASARSEEHTSELQSLTNLVCRLLLEKKNTPISTTTLS